MEVVNQCRLKQVDLSTLLQDNETVNEIKPALQDGVDPFVRVLRFGHANQYRLRQFGEFMEFRSPYQFMNKETTMGMRVSYGSKIMDLKMNLVSDEDVTEDEVKEWLHKIQKDGQSVPDAESLDMLKFIVEELPAIREMMDSVATTKVQVGRRTYFEFELGANL